MTSWIVVAILIFIVAFSMTMVGKGGGNFYVLILAIAGLPMHHAAATGQFILFTAALAAMIVFQRGRSVSWPLAIGVGCVTAVSAFGGGYFSDLLSGFLLKCIFAGMLGIAGLFMFFPISEKRDVRTTRTVGILTFASGAETYAVNLWIAVPVILVTGFGSGMVGVSGGSFLVPLMVVACGVPVHTAVGTASTLIATSALMGFTGHALQGHVNPSWAIPLALVTVSGGLLGGKCALKTRPSYLKQLFAYTNWLAAIVMGINALHTQGIM